MEFPLDPDVIAAEIGVPLERWPGNCHAIAERVVTKMPIEGMRLVRGHFSGYISPDSVYGGRAVTQHSWLQLADGRILDPTRWCIETPGSPAIYLGDGADYDPESATLQAQTRAHAAGSLFSLISGSANRKQDAVLRALSEKPVTAAELAHQIGGAKMSQERLADQVIRALEAPARRIKDPVRVYTLASELGLSALIQIDKFNDVMRPEMLRAARGQNFFYTAPPAPVESDMQKLFKVINRFISVEKMDLRLESSLAEFGYELDEYYDALNEAECVLKHDEAPQWLPSNAHIISMMVADHLGAGYGAIEEVESYAQSLGFSPEDLDIQLRRLGELTGYTLEWDIETFTPSP